MKCISMRQSFCNCRFPTSLEVLTVRGSISDLVRCRCGEDMVGNEDSWNWHSTEDSDAIVTEREICFHPNMSRGTAIVAGEKPLKSGMLHYWEMRILTRLVGTDVMIGIGTQSVNLGQFHSRFKSALGLDHQSWGFSYSGQIQHAGKKRSYGQKFFQGSVIGVCLDRSNGQLEFYLNRSPLGVAFTNVPTDPRVNIYPMVCSTQANSVIRLINSTSQPITLRLRSFQALVREELEDLRKIPGFRGILESYWFLGSE